MLGSNSRYPSLGGVHFLGDFFERELVKLVKFYVDQQKDIKLTSQYGCLGLRAEHHLTVEALLD